MKLRIEKATRTSLWLSVPNSEASFAKVYVNKPGTRTVDGQLEEAARQLAHSGELREIVEMAGRVLEALRRNGVSSIDMEAVIRRCGYAKRYIEEGI